MRKPAASPRLRRWNFTKQKAEKGTRNESKNVARVGSGRRTSVFKALGKCATLEFALDENVPTDEELVLSAVRVRHYFVD